MKRYYPINRILREITSTIPLQFEEVDFQMQLDAQASKFQAFNLKNLII